MKRHFNRKVFEHQQNRIEGFIAEKKAFEKRLASAKALIDARLKIQEMMVKVTNKSDVTLINEGIK